MAAKAAPAAEDAEVKQDFRLELAQKVQSSCQCAASLAGVCVRMHILPGRSTDCWLD